MKSERYQTSWHFIWREQSLRTAISIIKSERAADPQPAWDYKIRPRIIRKYGGFPYMLHWDIYERYNPHKRKPQD